ncbi:MAG: alpha/beta hydrolase, partial [Actinobacteria bacterium]|nr:alpha/beta hydrolase [Actinomycetota bacterium]
MDVVVLVPSLGRPATDFDALCVSLEAEGFRTVALEP